MAVRMATSNQMAEAVSLGLHVNDLTQEDAALKIWSWKFKLAVWETQKRNLWVNQTVKSRCAEIFGLIVEVLDTPNRLLPPDHILCVHWFDPMFGAGGIRTYVAPQEVEPI
ncbi:MAG: hypothetical protein NVSMB66_7100 [Candidatus Doudnabacteria bacterium]